MSGLFYNLEAGTTTAEALEKWLEKGLFILLSGPVLCYNSSRLHWQRVRIGGGCDLHLDSFKGTRA